MEIRDIPRFGVLTTETFQIIREGFCLAHQILRINERYGNCLTINDSDNKSIEVSIANKIINASMKDNQPLTCEYIFNILGIQSSSLYESYHIDANLMKDILENLSFFSEFTLNECTGKYFSEVAEIHIPMESVFPYTKSKYFNVGQLIYHMLEYDGIISILKIKVNEKIKESEGVDINETNKA